MFELVIESAIQNGITKTSTIQYLFFTMFSIPLFSVIDELIDVCTGKKTGIRDIYIISPGGTRGIPDLDYHCQCTFSKPADQDNDPTVAVQSRDTRLNAPICRQSLVFEDDTGTVLGQICSPYDTTIELFATKSLDASSELTMIFRQIAPVQGESGSAGIFMMRVRSSTNGEKRG